MEDFVGDNKLLVDSTPPNAGPASDHCAATRLMVLADVLGRNSTDCADLPDPKAAQDVLLALRAQPSVTAACIYNDDGKP
jgi:hypothetical protein